MKPLILILSCHADSINGRQFGVEDTWLSQWSGLVDVKILIGKNIDHDPMSWELVFDVDDSYDGQCKKYKRGRQWALANGYNYVFSACVDTWINVPRLLKSGFEKYEYSGYRCDQGHGSGGSGFWLGPHALRLAAAADLSGYDDLAVGNLMRSCSIPLHHDARYSAPGNPPPPGVITLHLSRGTGVYDPAWMREVHEQYRAKS